MASLTNLVPGWYPPSRENWETISYLWQFFPLLTAFQYLTDFYPQGKTSTTSRFNLPGKWAWCIMEIPGFLTALYCCLTIPHHLHLPGATSPGLSSFLALPIGNKTMAVLYTIHYIYRAILSPLFLNPSMSPIHIFVAASAFGWQLINGLSLGGWLGGYGPTSVDDWAGRAYVIEVGLVVFGWGLLANMYHDDELREIRRQVAAKQVERESDAERKAAKEGKKQKPTVDKVYRVPQNGLFRLVLFPHYLCEWIEWGGFWMIGGLGCVPARSFLVNEVATMLPRALQGRRWYVEKFGKEKVEGKKAVIPFLV